MGRYENTHRLVVNSLISKKTEDLLSDGVEYDNPALVVWFYAMEPPPLGEAVGWFREIETREEEKLFTIMATGLPANSHLQIGSTTGYIYMENATTGLWHRIRINGPDGNVYMEIAQNGIVSPT